MPESRTAVQEARDVATALRSASAAATTALRNVNTAIQAVDRQASTLETAHETPHETLQRRIDELEAYAERLIRHNEERERSRTELQGAHDRLKVVNQNLQIEVRGFKDAARDILDRGPVDMD